MAKIAIFDSGVGGLSVYQEVALECPRHDYVFLSDNQAFPYGTKNAAELSDRVIRVVGSLLEQYKPNLLVVACNTASTLTLPALRARYDLPIVGVVPAIKPAAKLSQSNVIGLLATPATVNRSYTNDLIKEFASRSNVVKLGSSELVQMAEDKLRGKGVDKLKLERILEPLMCAKDLDILVLACTHFPLLKREIESLFKLRNHAVNIIDSGSAIAKRVSELLTDELTRNTSQNMSFTGHSCAVFTHRVDDTQLIENLSSRGFKSTGVLSIA